MSAAERNVPSSTGSDTYNLLRKKRFSYLQNVGPFFFFQAVEKLSKFSFRNSRLCFVNDSVVAGAYPSSGEISFSVRVEDIAELITDSRHLGIGVRIRDSPYGCLEGHHMYTDMPVDFLLFMPSAGQCGEFVDAVSRVYTIRTDQTLTVRERGPKESFSAALTLIPEGRRVRKPAPLTVGDRPQVPAHAGAMRRIREASLVSLTAERRRASAFSTGSDAAPFSDCDGAACSNPLSSRQLSSDTPLTDIVTYLGCASLTTPSHIGPGSTSRNSLRSPLSLPGTLPHTPFLLPATAYSNLTSGKSCD